ncbi:MAG: MocR-like pyridoxine biosynthesis transcription factor PdxR [Alphaproteobacteria bacterium]
MLDVFSGVVDLERTAPVSLYLQLYEQLRGAILDGRLPAGSRVPSSRAMAAQLRVARNTVLAAVEQLTAEGFLETRQGAGTLVSAQLSDELTRAARKRTSGKRPAYSLSATGKRLASISRTSDGGETPKPFLPGIPDIGAFPTAIWARLLRRETQRLQPEALAYGWTAGHPKLREVLCAHLREMRGIQAEPDQIIITSSAQAALDLLARALVGPGDAVWLEEPGYLGARAAFSGAGAELVPVPVDGQGLNPNGKYASPSAIYVTPSHQYPTGRLMPLARRLELLEAAERYGAYVIEDDYDSEFQFQGRPVAALQGLDPEGRVLYVGTFSKILQPGLRVGYAVVPSALAEPLARMQRNTGQIVSVAVQLALAAFIEEGHLRAHVRRVCALYEQRQKVLANGLSALFEGRLVVEKPAGGMQLIAGLPDGMSDAAIVKTLAAHGVQARPLSGFYLGKAKSQGLLLGFAGYSSEAIEAGLKEIKGILLF